MMLSWIVYHQILEGKMVISYQLHSQMYCQQVSTAVTFKALLGTLEKERGNPLFRQCTGIFDAKSMVHDPFGCEDQ